MLAVSRLPLHGEGRCALVQVSAMSQSRSARWEASCPADAQGPLERPAPSCRICDINQHHLGASLSVGVHRSASSHLQRWSVAAALQVLSDKLSPERGAHEKHPCDNALGSAEHRDVSAPTCRCSSSIFSMRPTASQLACTSSTLTSGDVSQLSASSWLGPAAAS